MDPRRLVVGVIRVVRAATGRRGVRADGGARGVSTKSTKKPRQLFRFQFQRQLKGFCTESSPNIYTLTLVNGSVWAAGTRPLRLIESLAFRRRSTEDGEDEEGDGLENASSSRSPMSSMSSMSPMSPILENLIRLLTLSVYFTPLVLLSVPCMVFGVRRVLWVRLLRVTLSVSGPAFIKWGQWAATRHDMFPIDVCRELQTLHADAPSHSLKHTDREIEESFGFRREDLFDRFEEVPVASGSIGQIYRCELSGVGSRLTGMAAGTVVAVKVRHPGVIEVIQRDFELITAIVDGLERVFCGVDGLRLLKESLSQFSLPLREQVDLSREGKYLGMFAENFRGEKRYVLLRIVTSAWSPPFDLAYLTSLTSLTSPTSIGSISRPRCSRWCRRACWSRRSRRESTSVGTSKGGGGSARCTTPSWRGSGRGRCCTC